MKFIGEIPQRAFINAQIIMEAEKTGLWNDAVESISDSYGLTGYSYSNQAHIVSLLYCLLVVPKEIWIQKDKAHPLLEDISESELRGLFNIQVKKDQNFDSDFKYNLIHKLRNAVAHANYDVDEELTFTFWNSSTEDENFRCSASKQNIMRFLSEVGAVLANFRSQSNA